MMPKDIPMLSRKISCRLLVFLTVGVLCLPGASPVGADGGWPDLSRPAAEVGGGEADAGVVVAIEAYGFVPPVPGAELNAKAWYDYLTRTRGAAPANVKLLLGVDATRDDMLDAVQEAASKAGPRGSLWFVFVGHGAPSADGRDGLLVGVDAQQKAGSLQKRSFRRQELLAALAKSRAGSIAVILDACFSGRGQDGASIAPGLQPLVLVAAAASADPRIVVLTAAKGDQFAGALPGTNRPAFSYLTLGALRGWASGKNGRVTAGAVWSYAKSALEATLRGRNQTPDLMGNESAVLGLSAGEKSPDLADLAKATAGGAVLHPPVPNLPAAPSPRPSKARIQWVSIPGGSFMMGSNDGASDEKPVHRVTVKAFQMAKTEVTNKQYRACVEAQACGPPSSYTGGDDHPVVYVNWEDARKFSEWAGGRLPTEAEWEYAARGAGKDLRYPWGNEDATCERAEMDDGGTGCGKNTSWPVCSKAAGNTAQGLCDMAGNVWEWTQDWYHDSYNGAPADGGAWESPAGSFRGDRGGSWSSFAGNVRAAVRRRRDPGHRVRDGGFRVVRGRRD